MSEFSLILVLQNKTSKIINVMCKYMKKRHTFIYNDYPFFTQIGRFVFFCFVHIC